MILNHNVSIHFVAPTGPPQDIMVSVIDSKSINITWSSTREEDTNGIVRHFVINVTQEVGDTQQLTVSALKLYHVMRNLQPNTNYSISIAAVTVDIGQFSNALMVEMPEAGKC